jgi:hypothetical protein
MISAALLGDPLELKEDSMISAALLENPKGTRGLPRLC